MSDQKTYEYIKKREFTPKGEEWDKAMTYWKTLYTDEGSIFDKELTFDGSSKIISFWTHISMQ